MHTSGMLRPRWHFGIFVGVHGFCGTMEWTQPELADKFWMAQDCRSVRECGTRPIGRKNARLPGEALHAEPRLLLSV